MKDTTNENIAHESFAERYALGNLPWDDVLPPPEVQAVVAKLPAGRALDLGCGYGRTSIYLAQHGWQVDGVDFVPQAITEAKKRAAAANIAEQIQFHAASVTALDFLQDNSQYQLAVDVGCMHVLDDTGRQAYHDHVSRLLAPDALFLLFARLTLPGEQPEDGPSGLTQTAVLEQFSSQFQLRNKEIGVTHVEDKSWESGWFWFRRTQDE